MTPPPSTPLDTPQGPIHTVDRRGTDIYRVGYAPTPWEWTPWEYATDDRFAGRWDDPDGVWRTLYCGISALACYLEVLAFARPSAQLVAELDHIIVDDDDADTYPTLPPGRLPRGWCEPRMIGHGALTGRFALPTHPQTLATLRTIFRAMAIRYGLDDLDTAALRDGRPRALTQAISAWIYRLTLADEAAVAGIEFDSRHGDHLHMWALYERDGDLATSPTIGILDHSPIDPTGSELAEAMRLLDLEWSDD